jgi:hypothetical protein
VCARSRLRPLFFCLLLIAALAGCAPSERLTARLGGDFSRGIRVGGAVASDEPALAVLPGEGGLAIAWAGEGEALHLARLAPDGRLLASGPLSLAAERPAQPVLYARADGTLTLLYVDGAAEGALTLTRLSAEGEVLAEETLSPSAPSYAAEADAAGALHVVWAAGDGALHYLHLAPDGGPAEAVALPASGVAPALRPDGAGRLHLVWTREPEPGLREVRYAVLAAGSGAWGAEAVLATLPVPTGLVLREPAVGLAEGDVYVYWALERRGGGLAQPFAETSYVVFPAGRPEEAGRPGPVRVPAPRDPALAPAESAWPITRLAPAPDDARPAGFVYYPSPAAGAGDELAVAMAVQLEGRTRAQTQIVLTLWADGALRGYQVVADTPNGSLRPRLLADGAGDLYVAWVDTAGFGAYDVYVSGTPEPMRAHLGRLRPVDVVEAVLTGAWSLVQVFGFLPMTVAWLLPPLLLLALYVLIQPEGDLARSGPRAILAAASVVYLGAKYILRPGWMTEFPTPAWLAPAWAGRLMLLAPLGIAALAGLVTWLTLRRREYPSLFPAFFLFAGSDTLLTLLMYVPAVLSE